MVRQAYSFLSMGAKRRMKYDPLVIRRARSREASEAVARLNQVNPQQVIFAQQNPEVINQGVFHNDVIAVSNRQVLFCHEAAFARQKVLINQLRTRVDGFMAMRSRRRGFCIRCCGDLPV